LYTLASVKPEEYAAREKIGRLLDRVNLPHVFYPDGLPPNTVIRIAKHFPQGDIGFLTTNRAGIWGDFRSGITFPFDMLDSEGLSTESDDADPDAYAQKVWECIERYKKKPMLLVERKVFCLEVVLADLQAVYLPSPLYARVSRIYAQGREAAHYLRNDARRSLEGAHWVVDENPSQEITERRAGRSHSQRSVC
jgi:hypothetical protein